MSHAELLENFRSCQRYKLAKPWQKPFINPRRFVTNQLRSHGILAGPAGEVRQSAAFHLPEFTLVQGEAVSQQIESYGIYEDTLTEAFLRLVQPGQVAVDVGMHLGYYTTLFACLVGEFGQVHAFEPTPSTRELAQHNVRRFPNVIVHPEALWSCVQTLSFRDYGVAWMAFNSFTNAKLSGVPEPKSLSVPTTTLDDFRRSLTKPISLLKIDAESAEREILEGGKEAIRADYPLIALEVGDSAGAPTSRSVVDCLGELGYVAWEFRASRFHRHQSRDVYAYDNLIFAPARRDLTSS
ncbi:MAG: FkbM family methyltransferase [Verrucomicrobiales bacterium]|nr:FkbM family methyltransferase [Verrucomicrobiales bacterium]